MPELPEVETVCRFLNKSLVGKSICSATVLWERTLGGASLQDFSRQIAGTKVLDVSRRGKFLHIHLDRPISLLVHLRMSGDFLMTSPDQVHKHARICWELSSGELLQFIDQRKFGRVYVRDAAGVAQVFAKLGPEPLDESFTAETLAAQLRPSARPIKIALLDQSLVAGLGNIYVIESLWHSKINPRKKANRLRKEQVRELHRNMRTILRQAIAANGTDLGDGVWEYGGYTTACYGKSGEPCCRCGAVIRHMVMGQRGTDYCPKCQR